MTGSSQTKKCFGHRYSEDSYAGALAAIRSSKSANIKLILRHPLPSYSAIIRRCRLDETFRAKFHDALSNRDSPKRYRADAFVQALKLIKANPNIPVRMLLKTTEVRLPSPRQLDWRIERDPSLRSLANPIRRLRRQAFSYRRKLAAKPALPDRILIAGLRKSEIYAVAERAVSKHFDSFDRDDVISEMVLAILDGELSINEAQQSGSEFARRFFRPQKRSLYRSLDEPVFAEESGSIPFVDTFTSDHWNFA